MTFGILSQFHFEFLMETILTFFQLLVSVSPGPLTFESSVVSKSRPGPTAIFIEFSFDFDLISGRLAEFSVISIERHFLNDFLFHIFIGVLEDFCLCPVFLVLLMVALNDPIFPVALFSIFFGS